MLITSYHSIVLIPVLQGKILHPDQDRVLSVREYARAQGIPDSHVFRGELDDMYRQVSFVNLPLTVGIIGFFSPNWAVYTRNILFYDPHFTFAPPATC